MSTKMSAYIVGLGPILTLIGFWLLLSGLFKPLLLGLGLISVVLTYFLMRRTNVLDGEARLNIFALFGSMNYAIWLGWQIIVSALNVATIILNPKLPISPRIVVVKTQQKSDLAKCLFANSITMTPGTVALNVKEDEIVVHALTESSGKELLEGAMNNRVAAIEKPLDISKTT